MQREKPENIYCNRCMGTTRHLKLASAPLNRHWMCVVCGLMSRDKEEKPLTDVRGSENDGERV